MVGLFFVVNNKLLLHSCTLEEAEKYGDFLNFPESHMQIWDKYYYNKYKVDFDYFPRGRIIYNIKENVYYIYYDKCLENSIRKMNLIKENKNVKYLRDLHYKCSKCNKSYIV